MAKKTFKPGRGYTKKDWDDVDSPGLTDEQLAKARPFAEALPDLAEAIRRGRGRPKIESPKEAVSLRLDADIVASYRETGDGWQSRINADLRKVRKLKKTA